MQSTRTVAVSKRRLCLLGPAISHPSPQRCHGGIQQFIGFILFTHIGFLKVSVTGSHLNVTYVIIYLKVWISPFFNNSPLVVNANIFVFQSTNYHPCHRKYHHCWFFSPHFLEKISIFVARIGSEWLRFLISSLHNPSPPARLLACHRGYR